MKNLNDAQAQAWEKCMALPIGDGHTFRQVSHRGMMEITANVWKAAQEAVRKDLLDSGLLEEFTDKDHGGLPITHDERGHNTLARAIKTHLLTLNKG